MSHQPEPILVVNASTTCPDEEIRHYVAAIQAFMPQFNKAWNLPEVDVAFQPRGQRIPDGFGHLQVVCDTAAQATYLGFHEVAKSGHPIGYTFAQTGRAAGASVSGTLSHELFESRVNPMIDKEVVGPDGRRWWLEICDAPEADEWGITQGMPTGKPVLLSNFCLPNYYRFNAPAGAAYDYRGLLRQPIPAMLAGGYLAFQEPNGTYGQIDRLSDKRARAAARPMPLSRRYRAMFRTWETAEVEGA